ncbi:MAG TPA: sulfate adenylyltransferase subunit CysD [Bacteroidia bacterium]|nr:sulfate adenylyltransferase subunit CysD [Bacteroidia bacterium]HNS12226.1 sulfate adenylyltransferase subunit CysD [Bacteroidia bacterium]
MFSYNLDHLKSLEAESIYILRELVSLCENPVLLFSGGKDSIVSSHLARKAFYPASIPFPFLHIDTEHNFPETISFRDQWVKKLGAKLIVRSVQQSIDEGRVTEEKGIHASRNTLQTTTLLDAIKEFRFDAAIGGARRDEEKARAKERFFSHRDEFGQWDPKNQRPELWNLFNARKSPGEHFRVFPLSNWTELDIWKYILHEKIEIPSLYYSHKRKVVQRNGQYLAMAEFIQLSSDEKPEEKIVRFRTIGDMTCTGAVESVAGTIDEIIKEIIESPITERGTRHDDLRSDSAMEDRKKKGYF